MRIIAGKWKGKALLSPENNEIRPTSDRARESLFNLLMHMPDSPVIDKTVVDLCCGSGALGLEALSRGASHCTFIDNAGNALALTNDNIDVMGARAQSKVLQSNASQLPAAPAPAALVLMDPPYKNTTIVGASYHSLLHQGWLAEGSLFCLEQFYKAEVPELEKAEIIKQRRYGKSEITIYQITA